MKKILFVLVAIVASYSASAQFHIELGLNFNSPKGKFADTYKLGIGGYLEPRYALNENIDLGLLINQSVFAGADLDTGTGNGTVDATGVLLLLPNATYRFSKNKITPYAGLATGIYAFQSVQVSNTSENTIEKRDAKTKLGFAPRAGVYLGRLNLGLAYNIVKDANFVQFNLGVWILERK